MVELTLTIKELSVLIAILGESSTKEAIERTIASKSGGDVPNKLADIVIAEMKQGHDLDYIIYDKLCNKLEEVLNE